MYVAITKAESRVNLTAKVLLRSSSIVASSFINSHFKQIISEYRLLSADACETARRTLVAYLVENFLISTEKYVLRTLRRA
jgi:hypothetical protein